MWSGERSCHGQHVIDDCCHVLLQSVSESVAFDATDNLMLSILDFCNHLYCLSNALHSSIGQNIKSHTVSVVRCPVSVIRCPFSGQSVKTSNGHNSATRHPTDFVFGSMLGFFSKDNFI